MRLKEARERSNFTQEQMSYYTGVSLRHYQFIEHGKSMPSIKIALRIAKLLKVDPRKVDEWTEKNPPFDQAD